MWFEVFDFNLLGHGRPFSPNGNLAQQALDIYIIYKEYYSYRILSNI
jgi:hypothetical protein